MLYRVEEVSHIHVGIMMRLIEDMTFIFYNMMHVQHNMYYAVIGKNIHRQNDRNI